MFTTFVRNHRARSSVQQILFPDESQYFYCHMRVVGIGMWASFHRIIYEYKLSNRKEMLAPFMLLLLNKNPAKQRVKAALSFENALNSCVDSGVNPNYFLVPAVARWRFNFFFVLFDKWILLVFVVFDVGKMASTDHQGVINVFFLSFTYIINKSMSVSRGRSAATD